MPLTQVKDGSSVERFSEVATSPSLGSEISEEDQIESEFEDDEVGVEDDAFADEAAVQDGVLADDEDEAAAEDDEFTDEAAVEDGVLADVKEDAFDDEAAVEDGVFADEAGAEDDAVEDGVSADEAATEYDAFDDEADAEDDAFAGGATVDDIPTSQRSSSPSGDEPQLTQAQEAGVQALGPLEDKDSFESPRSAIHTEESLYFESDEASSEEKHTIRPKVLCGVADAILLECIAKDVSEAALMGEISQPKRLQPPTRRTDEELVSMFGKAIHDCARALGTTSFTAGQPACPLSHEMLKAIERHLNLSDIGPDKQMLLFDLYNEVLGSLLREYPTGTAVGCDHLLSRATRTLTAWSNEQARSFPREVEATFKSYYRSQIFQEKLATDITQDVVEHLMQDCAYTLINCNV